MDADAGDLPLGAEEIEIVARVGRDERGHRRAQVLPGAAARAGQRPIGRDTHPHLFVRQQIVSGQRPTLAVGDLRAAGVAVAGLEVGQVLLDQGQHLLGRLEQRLQLADQRDQLAILVLQLAAFQGRQAAQLHIQDRLGLNLGEAELLDEAQFGIVRRLGLANERNHLIKHVQRPQQPFQDVGPLPGLLQLVLAAAHDHILPVLQEMDQHALQAQQPRLAFDQRQQRHAEGLLQRGQLEQVRQHLARLDGARHLDADPHPRAVGFIAQIGQPFQPAIARQLRDALNQVGLVGLVGQLGDHNAAAVAAHILDVGLRLHHDAAATAGVGLGDHILPLLIAVALLGIPERHAARGEVGAGDEAHQVFDGDIIVVVVVVDQVAECVAHLAQVVRRDVSGHADRNAAGAVDQQVRQRRGQDRRLLEGAVEVLRPVNGVLLDVGQHLGGDLGQPRLGVAHRGRVIAVDGAEVALAVHQRIAQAEILGHANHRLVHGRVAVRMVLAQHLTDDAGRLLVRLIGLQAQIVHRVEDAPVHGLQPVAHIGQRPRDDHAHRVVQIRRLHLGVNVDLADDA